MSKTGKETATQAESGVEDKDPPNAITMTTYKLQQKATGSGLVCITSLVMFKIWRGHHLAILLRGSCQLSQHQAFFLPCSGTKTWGRCRLHRTPKITYSGLSHFSPTGTGQFQALYK
jgi:hypothetical protein